MIPSDPRLRLDDAVAAVYDQLRNYASRILDRESDGLTLQTTDLVHEVYLRLSQLNEIAWDDQGEVMRAAVAVMRRVLVDHARAKYSLKRTPPGRRLMIDENAIYIRDRNRAAAIDLLGLDEALQRLAERDGRKAELVELRYFGGYNEQQTAEALGISIATVKRDWRLAKAWLYRELSSESRDEEDG